MSSLILLPISCPPPSGPVTLTFFRAHDRFAHALIPLAEEQILKELADITDPLTFPWIARSIEGAVDDAWPASPPLQECQRIQIADRPRILGTGAAGKSYWSMAVSNPRPGVVLFDLACRTSGGIPSGNSAHSSGGLGATYETPETGTNRPPTGRVQCVPGEIGAVQIRTDESSHRLRIVAGMDVPRSTTATPRTIRWTYELHITPGDNPAGQS